MNHAALVRFSVAGPDGYRMAQNGCSPGESHIRTCPERYQKNWHLQDKAFDSTAYWWDNAAFIFDWEGFLMGLACERTKL
jgi:hypothetical protein